MYKKYRIKLKQTTWPRHVHKNTEIEWDENNKLTSEPEAEEFNDISFIKIN